MNRRNPVCGVKGGQGARCGLEIGGPNGYDG